MGYKRPCWKKKNHKAEWGGRVREGAMRELRSRKRIWFFVFVRQGPYYVAQAGPKSYLPASLTEGIGLQVYVITLC